MTSAALGGRRAVGSRFDVVMPGGPEPGYKAGDDGFLVISSGAPFVPPGSRATLLVEEPSPGLPGMLPSVQSVSGTYPLDGGLVTGAPLNPVTASVSGWTARRFLDTAAALSSGR